MSTSTVKLEDLTANSSPADFEAVLSNKDTVTNMLKDGKFGSFVKDYASAKARDNKDVMTQVREEVQASIQEWVKDSGGQLKRLNLEPGDPKNRSALAARKNTLYNAKAPGASIDATDSAPEDWPEFLQAIWHHSNTLQNSDELREKQTAWKKIQNSYGSQVPADGGFLIPEVLRSELLQLAMEESIVRSRAQVIPMSSLAIPIPTVDETSRVSSVFGGIVAYWTEEGAAMTESNAKSGRVRPEAKKLTVYSAAPHDLIADAPAFGGFLSANLPRAASFYEDAAFLNGSGVGEPLGVLNAGNSGLIKVARTTGGTDGEDTFNDVVKLFTRLLPGSYATAVWLAAPDVVPHLLQMTMSTTGGGVPSWLTGGQLIQGAPLTLLGRPLIITEKVPKLADTGDLSLIDFSHYLVGDRQMMQASSSPHFKFSSDVTAFKIVERVDGRPWVSTPLTPHNNGASLSPYVTRLVT